MIVNKNILLDSMNRNKDRDSIIKVAENSSIVYNTPSEALYEIVSFISNNPKLNSSDKKRVINILDKKLIKESTVKPLFNTCNKLSKEVNDVEIKESLKLFNRSLVITNRESMVINNSEAIKRKINISKIIENFKLDKSNEYYKIAIHEMCDMIKDSYNGYSTKDLVKVCSESIRFILKERKIYLSDAEILNPIIEYFSYTTNDDKLIQEGISELLLFNESVVDEILDNISTEVKINTIKESNNITPLELKEINSESVKNGFNQIFEDGDVMELISELEYADADAIYKVLSWYKISFLYGRDDRPINSRFFKLMTNLVIEVLIRGNELEIKKYLDAFSRKELIEIEGTKVSDFIKNSYLTTWNDCMERLILALDNMDIIKEYNEDHLAHLGACIIVYEDAVKNNVTFNVDSVKRLLLTAKEKSKAVLDKMSATEKQVSRTIDTNIGRIQDSIIRASQLENRDRVIEGKILPSFSKIVKLAMAEGVLYVINPVLPIIGAIGIIAISKNTRDRERQYILDELNIHLRIAEKKIDQAEMSGSHEELEALMKIEAKLKREKQRIEYRQRLYRGKSRR